MRRSLTPLFLHPYMGRGRPGIHRIHVKLGRQCELARPDPSVNLSSLPFFTRRWKAKF